MKVYIDTSWLLRVLLQQGEVKRLPRNAEVYSSALLHVEACRTLDRQTKRGLITEVQMAKLRGQLDQYLEFFNLIEIDRDIIKRAAEPFALPLGTLDAVHLATAIKIREVESTALYFASFDDELRLAAMAHGFKLIDT